MWYLKEKFKNRHKILEVLVKQLAPHYETEDVNVYDELLLINDISNSSKIAKQKVIGQIDYLLHYEEISVLWSEGVPKYNVTAKGTISYYDEKYLDQGGNIFRQYWWELIKGSISLIAIIISVSTFVVNMISTSKNNQGIEEIKTELHVIKKEIQLQKTNLKQVSQTTTKISNK